MTIYPRVSAKANRPLRARRKFSVFRGAIFRPSNHACTSGAQQGQAFGRLSITRRALPVCVRSTEFGGIDPLLLVVTSTAPMRARP